MKKNIEKNIDTTFGRDKGYFDIFMNGKDTFENRVLSFDTLKMQANYLNELNDLRKNDTTYKGKGSKESLLLNPELISSASFSSWLSGDTSKFKNKKDHYYLAYFYDYFSDENLSFGCGKKDSPFNGWYYNEKILYEKGERYLADIGHYVTCVKDYSFKK